MSHLKQQQKGQRKLSGKYNLLFNAKMRIKVKSEWKKQTSCRSYTFCDFLMVICSMFRIPLTRLVHRTGQSSGAKILPILPSVYSNLKVGLRHTAIVSESFEDGMKGSMGQKPFCSSSFGDRICEQKQENNHIVHHHF